MRNPYEALPADRFWKTGVLERETDEFSDIWTPKHLIQPNDSVVTLGSCFAQHIGRKLVVNSYNWVDAEPGPEGLSEVEKRAQGFNVFSFRVGNLYTAAQLKQWVDLAFKQPASRISVEEAPIEQGGRFFDPLRPGIPERGFASLDDLMAARDATLASICSGFERCDYLIFTLGLTEAWLSDKGFVYSMCPGTLVGEFDQNRHHFKSYRYQEIYADLVSTMDCLKGVCPKIRFLLTVSPVPLTATAADEHVLLSTTYSKSVLRAVAGDLTAQRNDTDYFPAYELVSSFVQGDRYYTENKRSINDPGVNYVMKHFFGAFKHALKKDPKNKLASGAFSTDIFESHNRIIKEICEEETLGALVTSE